MPIDATFRMNEVYDDAQWRRLFEAASGVLQKTPEEAETVFARFFYEKALEQWPKWFQMSQNAREFLERQPLIHNGFSRGLQDPAARKNVTEKFRLESVDRGLVMHYKSSNRLCGLYKELVNQIVSHYDEDVAITETRCMKNGAPECEIEIKWN